MHSKRLYRIILWTATLLCACSPALYMPTMTDASRTGVSTDSLMMGRTLYVKHCGSCHNLHLPEQFTRSHWEDEIPDMQDKAKLSDKEAQLITKFVLARSKPD